VVDPAEMVRYGRAAALCMAAVAVLVVVAIVMIAVGVPVAGWVLIVLAFISAATAVVLATRAKRLAVARRDELRARYPNV
jgi:hypothetical protein